jgi:hypothetical protein
MERRGGGDDKYGRLAGCCPGTPREGEEEVVVVMEGEDEEDEKVSMRVIDVRIMDRRAEVRGRS